MRLVQPSQHYAMSNVISPHAVRAVSNVCAFTVRTKVSQDRGCLPHKAGMGKVKAQLFMG